MHVHALNRAGNADPVGHSSGWLLRLQVFVHTCAVFVVTRTADCEPQRILVPG